MNNIQNFQFLTKLFVTFLGILHVIPQKCLSRSYGEGRTVCVCNKDHCDTIDPVKKVAQGSYLKYTSNKDGLRFEKEEGNFVKTTDQNNTILILSDKTFQKINGFGGAFTDAVSINILSLEEDVRNKLMR